MWALGCILYEISCGTKMFHNDLALLLYTRTGTLDQVPVEWQLPPTGIIPSANKQDEWAYSYLHNLILRLLQLEPSSRPSSRAIAEELVPKLDLIFESDKIWSEEDISKLFIHLSYVFPANSEVLASIIQPLEVICRNNSSTYHVGDELPSSKRCAN